MKVFLDIGAHTGETLSTVLEGEWAFDRVVCFEPAPSCWPTILERSDRRVELCRFGLWSADQQLTLNNPGQIGASMSVDKDAVFTSEVCQFRDAGAWFEENLDDSDEVYAKINVEGAEVEIIARLAATNQLQKVDHLLVHFDVRKIPDLRGTESVALEALDSSGIEFLGAEDILYGGVYRGTRNWLRWCAGDRRTRDFRYRALARIESALRRKLYPLKRFFVDRRND